MTGCENMTLFGLTNSEYLLMSLIYFCWFVLYMHVMCLVILPGRGSPEVIHL